MSTKRWYFEIQTIVTCGCFGFGLTTLLHENYSILQYNVDLFILFCKVEVSAQKLLAPANAINVEDGASKVSGSFNALHTAGVELNNPELRDNSQKPVWKAKQQFLGLLKVCGWTNCQLLT